VQLLLLTTATISLNHRPLAHTQPCTIAHRLDQPLSILTF
jgi:hypothetical protein